MATMMTSRHQYILNALIQEGQDGQYTRGSNTVYVKCHMLFIPATVLALAIGRLISVLVLIALAQVLSHSV